MSKHITEWLNAYLDGELHGSRLQHVETHLAGCDLCQADLESLKNMSGLLHEVPAPEFISADRFAAQVNLRLPRQQITTSGNNFLEIGWWMIPVGLLAAWIFIGTSSFVSDVLSAANHLGLLHSISTWLVSGPSRGIDWSATLGQLGLLDGSGLNWVEATETFTRVSLPQISLHVSIALLYLSWIAIWWARHTRHQRQQHGQLLES